MRAFPQTKKPAILWAFLGVNIGWWHEATAQNNPNRGAMCDMGSAIEAQHFEWTIL
jgi:hypothetical protein